MAGRSQVRETTAPTCLIVDVRSETVFASSSPGAGGDLDLTTACDDDGLPTAPGRTLRGLLRHACWQAQPLLTAKAPQAAARLFPDGQRHDGESILHIGDARIDGDAAVWLRQWARTDTAGVAAHLKPALLRDEHTTVLTTTAVDASGTARAGSLRKIRAIRPGVRLTAPLRWSQTPTVEEMSALAVCALAVRAAGLRRTRGFGRVRLLLPADGSCDTDNVDVQAAWQHTTKLAGVGADA